MPEEQVPATLPAAVETPTAPPDTAAAGKKEEAAAPVPLPPPASPEPEAKPVTAVKEASPAKETSPIKGDVVVKASSPARALDGKDGPDAKAREAAVDKLKKEKTLTRIKAWEEEEKAKAANK